MRRFVLPLLVALLLVAGCEREDWRCCIVTNTHDNWYHPTTTVRMLDDGVLRSMSGIWGAPGDTLSIRYADGMKMDRYVRYGCNRQEPTWIR